MVGNEEKTRLLVKVSSLYYIDGLNQQEIAARLGISRPQVSRMLSSAKSEGIVQISIKNPYSEEQQYERAIAETFGIHDVIIVNVADADRGLVDLQLARTSAALLETVLKDNDIVGVMAGKTVAAIGAELGFTARKGLQFIPLVGGWGADGATWHANSNTRLFGEKLRSKFLQLHAPAVVASAAAREVFLQEPEIAEVIQFAKRATVAIVSIGQVSDQATMVRTGFFDAKEMEEMKQAGAAANLCTSFIDAKGAVVPYPTESRMIGLSAEELREIPNIIAVASGEDKVAAVGAALRGRWMDVLVTDLETAKSVLEWHRLHPVS